MMDQPVLPLTLGTDGPHTQPHTEGAVHDVTVVLDRLPSETWVRWGMRFEENLVLSECAVGSIAASNERMRACVGMRVVTLDGAVIHDVEQVLD